MAVKRFIWLGVPPHGLNDTLVLSEVCCPEPGACIEYHSGGVNVDCVIRYLQYASSRPTCAGVCCGWYTGAGVSVQG